MGYNTRAFLCSNRKKEMAKKNKRNKKKEEEEIYETEKKRNLKEGTIQGILSIGFFILFVFFVLARFGLAGVVGARFYDISSFLLGFGYFLLPLLSVFFAISFLLSLKPLLAIPKLLGSFIFVFSGLGIITVLFPGNGGILGNFVATPLVALFDLYITIFILWGTLVISAIIVLEAELNADSIRRMSIFNLGKKEKEEDEFTEIEIPETEESAKKKKTSEETKKEEVTDSQEKEKPSSGLGNILNFGKEEKSSFENISREFGDKTYLPPPISLFEKDRGRPGVGDIKANANIIKRTLLNFGISVEMDEISVGPTVTRYALKPAEGVKLARIVNLQNDLALALAAHPIRIEAPIPGRALVGVEIPNQTKTTVGLGTLFTSPQFTESSNPLMITLGRGISGSIHFANLAKMPHLLVAGATGSGKSVTIHAIIASLLFRNSPENLKFLMVDPKRVELTLYNDIPHLLTPVIKTPKEAILALKWAAKEMDRRYDILESCRVRDVTSYHQNVLQPALDEYKKKKEKLTKKKDKTALEELELEKEHMPERLPYIVIIIDELADIMTSYPRELEVGVVRLAQMSRAVGIHLILSTQRPSVNIITGLIKANIPARIALQVSSQIDSRTILDTGGAEKLLGAGDMLYLSGEMSKPQRIQSAYVSENEAKKIVKFLKKSYQDELNEEIDLGNSQELDKNVLFESSLDNDEDDDLYEDAKQAVIDAGKASTSYIQRKLRVGYARAARLMDILEERGVVGPADGAKPREILLGAKQITEEEERPE